MSLAEYRVACNTCKQARVAVDRAKPRADVVLAVRPLVCYQQGRLFQWSDRGHDGHNSRSAQKTSVRMQSRGMQVAHPAASARSRSALASHPPVAAGEWLGDLRKTEQAFADGAR